MNDWELLYYEIRQKHWLCEVLLPEIGQWSLEHFYFQNIQLSEEVGVAT